LICASEGTISAFASIYFIGCAFGSILLPPFGDRFGRKKMFLGTTAVSFIGFLIILLLPGGAEHKNMIYVIYVVLFFGGMADSGKFPIGFCYFQEFGPEKYQGL
jgi:MFS family permease